MTAARASILAGSAMLLALCACRGTRLMGPRGERAPAGAPRGTETVEAIDAAWASLAHPTRGEYHEFLQRYIAVGGAGVARARAFARSLLAEADPDDRAAHAVLGHKEFTFEVPEEISFRKYPFVRAVEEAHAQRWFEDPDAYDLAVKAYEKAQRHAERLTSDRVYRALDGARQEVDRDEILRTYNYDAIFASPYLICYSTEERTDEEDLIRLPREERSKRLFELEARRVAYRRVLAEKAKILQQAYAEFMRRYAEPCGLFDLMGEFGGRPDLPISKRSYRDGCPLVVWVFSDRNAFVEYHEKIRKEPIESMTSGYLSHAAGWIFQFDEDKGDREAEVDRDVGLVALQLLYWFQRQKDEWGRPRMPPNFLSTGLSQYFGSVQMSRDRTLTFTGLNRPLLETLDLMRDQSHSAAKVMPLFPLKDLVSFEGYGQAARWALERWPLPVRPQGLDLFYVQSWALVQFLNEYGNHKYQPAFTRLVNDLLAYTPGVEHYLLRKFESEMGLASEDDWKALDDEFRAYYLGPLATTPLSEEGRKPPALDDWPGYAEPGPPLADGGR